MEKYLNMSPTEKFMFARTALDNSLNTPEIASAVSVYGYDTARLNDGKTLVDDAETLHNQKEIKYSEKFAATDSKETAFEDARKTYMKHVKLARVVLEKDQLALRQLGLVGKRADNESGFIEEATLFYGVALTTPSIQNRLATLNIDATQLQAAQAAVTDLQTTKTAQRNAKMIAERMTQRRNEKIEELDEWIGQYVKVARIALEEDPHLLEALGILVR